MSEHVLKEIQENVEVIFHYAAITDFFLPLNIILNCNVCGTLRVLSLAKKCKRLECFVHVSTLMNNAHLGKYPPTHTFTLTIPFRLFLEEKIYAERNDWQELLDSLLVMNDKELEIKKKEILKTYHNTYLFSKHLCENLLVKNRGKVPLVISRPAIVGASWKYPFPG